MTGAPAQGTPIQKHPSRSTIPKIGLTRSGASRQSRANGRSGSGVEHFVLGVFLAGQTCSCSHNHQVKGKNHMEKQTPVKKSVNLIHNSLHRSLWRRGFVLIGLTLALFALVP